MEPNLLIYLRWSSRILQSELLIILSLTISEAIISSTSCVTTTASPKNFRTVLNRYLMYSAIPSLAIACLLYTSDAADEEDSVDLGGRRIIKKKKKNKKKKQQ